MTLADDDKDFVIGCFHLLIDFKSIVINLHSFNQHSIRMSFFLILRGPPKTIPWWLKYRLSFLSTLSNP